MFIRSAYKYQLKGYTTSLIIFYGIIITIYVLLLTGLTSLHIVTINGAASFRFSSQGTITGLELATAVFLFVCGLCSFKEPFLFLYQNGVSRRGTYLSWLFVTLSIAGGCAFVDTLLNVAVNAITSASSSTGIQSLYETLYFNTASSQDTFILILSNFAFNLLLYLSALCFGYFITVLYYRMSKGAKIAVSISVPLFLLWILPFIDELFLHNRISIAVSNFIFRCFGNGEYLIAGLASFTVLSAVLYVLSVLMVRRVTVRP